MDILSVGEQRTSEPSMFHHGVDRIPAILSTSNAADLRAQPEHVAREGAAYS
jgi:hypothetical protein